MIIKERKEEAIQWLSGNRSVINTTSQYPQETWKKRIAELNLLEIEKSYWVLRVIKEGLL